MQFAYIAKKMAQKVGNQEELEKVKALTYDKSLIDTALLNKIITKVSFEPRKIDINSW